MVIFDTLNKLIKYFSLQEISDLLEFAPDESSNIKNLQIHFKDRKITFEYEFIHDDNIDNFDVEIPFQFIENEKIVIFNFNSGSDTDITSFIKKCELAIFGENNFTVKKDYSSYTIDLGQQIKKMEKDGTNTRYPKSVINFSTDKDSVVPTQKPVALIEYLINTYSNKGDVVLDPTMGSGTTGVACKNTGRHFIGIEINEETFNLAKKRIENTPVVINKVTEMF